MMRTIGFSIILFLFSCQSETEHKFLPDSVILKDYSVYFQEAYYYAKENNMDTNLILLVDLSQHSGKERGIIFRDGSIYGRFMVSHGSCGYTWSGTESKDSALYSNEIGSFCSAYGKYAIGERGRSDWGIGIKYLLYGLDSTNRNATKRDIVLHSWDAIPDDPVYPAGIPEGAGCPAVSNTTMRVLDILLQNKNKRVLLWIIK